jgi:F-type H+-transporting ATPase subunit delta
VTGAVGRRYAKALFALAAESGDFEAVGRELAQVSGAFGEAPLNAFAEDTTLDRKSRRTVAASVSEQLGVSRLMANFLGVLAENNRLRLLPAIASEYERLEDRSLGRVRALLRSARPLSVDRERGIRQALERRTGKQILAEARVDAALLGGVVVEVQGRVFDGSLRAGIERLKRSLSG